MVVAKNTDALENLAQQFKRRTIKKIYLALVYGILHTDEGIITLPIGRHPVHRKRMSTVSRKGRSAETAWQVRKRFPGITLLELTLKTGRTHQIRVHCATMDHPIVGDPVYRSRKWPKDTARQFPGESSSMFSALTSAPRQMLHAWRLGLTHPHTGERMTFESPIPEDMAELMEKLEGREHRAEGIEPRLKRIGTDLEL
jgi:23S rRNA pseudouridine1911/1915/1917 synthase